MAIQLHCYHLEEIYELWLQHSTCPSTERLENNNGPYIPKQSPGQLEESTSPLIVWRSNFTGLIPTLLFLTTACLRSSPFRLFRALEQILVFVFCSHGREVKNPALKVNIEITSTIQNGFKEKFIGSVDFFKELLKWDIEEICSFGNQLCFCWWSLLSPDLLTEILIYWSNR